VNWTTCGCALALAFAPALVQLPTATSAVLSSDQSRLSPPDDQASTMLSVASYATLTLTTSFSDGSRRVMTSDPRVTYSTQSARCGTVSTGRAYATSGARGASCTQIVVTAIVSLGGKNVTSSTTIALVYVSSLSVAFVGYPTSQNGNVALTRLYAIPCQKPIAYQHASPVATARLTDSTNVTVTSQCTYVSTSPFVVSVSGTSRLVALGPGVATIRATFGAFASNSTLVVSPAAANASSIVWNVGPSTPSSTMSQYVNTTIAIATTLTLAQSSGQSAPMTYVDIASSAFTSPQWLDVTQLVTFRSASAGAISVDAYGALTLRGNAYAPIGVSASVTCAPSISTTYGIAPNLLPLEMDVDVGSQVGVQFQQSGNSLPIDIRVRGITSVPNVAITAFSVVVYGYDTSILSSRVSNGSTFVSSGQFAGVQAQLDGLAGPTNVVGSAATISGANLKSTASGGASGLNVGTLTLGVVGSGVTLIRVDVDEIQVTNTLTTNVYADVQFVPALAGVGYASITLARGRSSGRRRMRDADADADADDADGMLLDHRDTYTPSAHSPKHRHRQLVSSTCNPCTSLVWGDFNGDCTFSPSDVTALQNFTLQRLISPFNSGVASDPLMTTSWTLNPATSCADFIRLQANPTRDVMSYGAGDSRYLAPQIDATDAQHLLLVQAKKYRLLADLNATCDAEWLHIFAYVVGGDGQILTTVASDPALTSVYAEVRVSPGLRDTTALSVSVGTPISSRTPAGGFPPSTVGNMGTNQSGALVQLASVGNGYYEARMRQLQYYTNVSYEFALLVETVTSGGTQYTPESFKPWLGSSILPYTASGFKFAPVWGGGTQSSGGGSSFVAGRTTLTCRGLAFPPPPPPTPPLTPHSPPPPPPPPLTRVYCHIYAHCRCH